MDFGHVHLLRKIWNNPVLRERNKKFSKLEAWLWILTREARGTDDPKAGLKRGEFCVSRRDLARVWKWSRSAVQRFFDDLQKGPDPMVKSLGQQAGHFTEHFIICKYGLYNKTWDEKWDSKRDILNKDKRKVKEKDSRPSRTAATAKDLFAIYSEENKNLPKAQVLSEDRASKCRARIAAAARQGRAERYLEDFAAAVRKAQSVPFLRGEGERGWTASFDWFVANDKNVYKVIEGNYDGLVRTPGKAKDLVGAGNGGNPAQDPADWTPERWKLFEKVNGAEAADRLREKFRCKGGKL